MSILKSLFGVTDTKIFKKLGRQAYISNGISIYDRRQKNEYLTDNNFLRVGFGRSTSGYGDWGGGFDRASTTPLIIILDKDLIIQKMETDSFYNSESSKKQEKIAEKLMKKLKVGEKLVLKDEEFIKHLTGLFSVLPKETHIGHDVFKHPHMLEHYMQKD